MARRSQAERINDLEASLMLLGEAVKLGQEQTIKLLDSMAEVNSHIQNLYRMNPPSKGALHPDLLRQNGLQ